MNENDFKKRFGSNSPLPPYNWSDDDYASGWNITGDMPPTRQQFDALQRTNDDKAAYLLDKVYSSARLLRRSTHYNKGDRVYAEGLKAGLYLECATAGMSGTDAIDFSSSKVGDTITDGGVTWTVVKYALTTDVPPLASALATPRKIKLTGNVTGSANFDGSKDIQIATSLANVSALAHRQPNTTYTAGQIAYHASLPTGYYLECTTPGTTGSGDITPSGTIGGTVTDGTVTWKVCKDIGTGNAPIFAGFNQMHTFTFSSSFTAPVTGTYKITLQGAGGGGGGGNDNYSGGGGGSGGFYIFYAPLVAGTSYSFTIGAGGTGATDKSAKGGDGGASSITINGMAYIANGGVGGGIIGSSSASDVTTAGYGGMVTRNGQPLARGACGSKGGYSPNFRVRGGAGGGYGGGSSVNPEGFFGGGGAGAQSRYANVGSDTQGYNGGDGYIIFEWLDPTLL